MLKKWLLFFRLAKSQSLSPIPQMKKRNLSTAFTTRQVTISTAITLTARWLFRSLLQRGSCCGLARAFVDRLGRRKTLARGEGGGARWSPAEGLNNFFNDQFRFYNSKLFKFEFSSSCNKVESIFKPTLTRLSSATKASVHVLMRWWYGRLFSSTQVIFARYFKQDKQPIRNPRLLQSYVISSDEAAPVY